MRTATTFAALVSVLSAWGTLGCASAPESSDDPELGQVEQQLWQPYHGGGGGLPYSDRLVGTNNYTGYALRSGSYVDYIKLEKVNKQGVRYRWPSGIGGSGGSDSGWISCPTGQYIVGMYGRAGMYLDQLGFYCGTLDHTTMSPQPAFGGTGGNPFTDICPAGEIMKNYSIRAGSWIDGIQINCGVPYFGPIP